LSLPVIPNSRFSITRGQKAGSSFRGGGLQQWQKKKGGKDLKRGRGEESVGAKYAIKTIKPSLKKLFVDEQGRRKTNRVERL